MLKWKTTGGQQVNLYINYLFMLSNLRFSEVHREEYQQNYDRLQDQVIGQQTLCVSCSVHNYKKGGLLLFLTVRLGVLEQSTSFQSRPHIQHDRTRKVG